LGANHLYLLFSDKVEKWAAQAKRRKFPSDRLACRRAAPSCPKKWEQACGMARRSVSNEEKSILREKAIAKKVVRNLRRIVELPGKSKL
jgi:hypothetical protein